MDTPDLARLAARIVAGTMVYVAIVILATPFPAAAGLTLTFPALNGLSFFFAEDEHAEAIAKTMFWMPVVNGLLCALYLLAFMLLAQPAWSGLVAWIAFFVILAAWLGFVTRKPVRAGIRPDRQLAYALLLSLAGIVLVIATSQATPGPGPHPAAPHVTALALGDASWMATALWRNSLKIALFAVALMIVVPALGSTRLSHATRGILAGLPLVPFGGLLAIAADAATSLQDRLMICRGMLASIWLGPAVAVWFIYAFSRFLSVRGKASQQSADTARRFAALVLGWLATFVVILLTGYWIASVGG